MVHNSAFVFIKPHAVTDNVKELVKEIFEKNGLEIKKEGELEAKEIDEKMLIDKHYYAIASKATILKPDKLNVPKDKFKDKFGLDWDEALKSGNVLNAKDACEKFEIDADAIDKLWAGAKKAGDLIKFGGGFYCGKLESPKDQGTYYVFNGFFMSMRSKFVAPEAKIYYYVVDFDGSKLTWEDFRGKVLGPTDPADAPEDSCRGAILKKWKELGLTSEPDVGDNGVHASASPFEGLAERMNWLGYRADRDPFGKILLKAGVTRHQLKDWVNDPQVTYGPIAMTGSLFDTLEDTNSDYCAALCQMIAASDCNPKENSHLEKEVEQLRKDVEMFQELERAVVAFQQFDPPAHTHTKGSSKGEGKGKSSGKGSEGRKGDGKGSEGKGYSEEKSGEKSGSSGKKGGRKGDGRGSEESRESSSGGRDGGRRRRRGRGKGQGRSGKDDE